MRSLAVIPMIIGLPMLELYEEHRFIAVLTLTISMLAMNLLGFVEGTVKEKKKHGGKS